MKVNVRKELKWGVRDGGEKGSVIGKDMVWEVKKKVGVEEVIGGW